MRDINSPAVLYNRLTETDTGCLEYSGATNAYGYGIITINYTSHKTHRVMWELECGEIPKDKLVLHKCDNRKCCNIEHLFLGNHQDNVDDMRSKGRDSFGENTGTRNGASKLEEDDVRNIRQLLDAGYTQQEIADTYNIDRKCVSKIKLGQTWGWLK